MACRDLAFSLETGDRLRERESLRQRFFLGGAILVFLAAGLWDFEVGWRRETHGTRRKKEYI